MSDFYNQHGQRPSNAGNYYAPPQDYGGHNSSYGGGDTYSAAPAGYNSYQPPRPDSANRYRGSPAPQYNNQVSQYRENDYYGEQRGSEHHHHSEKGGFAPVVYGDDRPSSRGSRDAGSERGFGDEKKPKYGKKDIGAMVAGAAVGGLAGHEVGHGGLATLIGAVAGAYGGHEIEKHHEEKKEKKRRESQGGYDNYSRRSISRERRGSARARSVSGSSSDSEYSRRSRRH